MAGLFTQSLGYKELVSIWGWAGFNSPPGELEIDFRVIEKVS